MILHCEKRWSLSALLCCLMCLILVVQCNKYQADQQHSESCTGDYCTAQDKFDDEPCMDEDGEIPEYDNHDDTNERLYRWDPVEVGHVRELELEPNKIFQFITRAVQPPVFEIPGFLTDDECDMIVNRTKHRGLFNSHVHMDPDSIAHEKKMNELIGHAHSPAGRFENWDDDEDGAIIKDEVKLFAAESKYLYLTDEEVDEMIKKLKLTEFDDGEVTRKEFENLRTAAMEKYFIEMKKSHPRHRDRFSEQTWLPHDQGENADKIMRNLRKRIVKVTRLPKKIVRGGEHLQVVHYDVHGHYHAHYDSQSGKQFSQFECCHQHLDKLPECRLCRYITILYYLNKPEEGGETAFPGADVEAFNETDFRERRDGDQYNLSEFCHHASLVVPPKKGTAIMWYNHHIDHSGWLGDLDWRSLHGGCDILKGEKWIANNWLTAPENGQQHITSNYYNDNDDDEEDVEDIEDDNDDEDD